MKGAGMENLIDLESSVVKKVLNYLLKDRTTGKNIIFATDAYGDGISFNTELTEDLLKNSKACDIKPRVLKSLEEQNSRTRKKAEVFTPSWVCNKMNNHCDAEWFGYENVFNEEKDHDWIPSDGKIQFPEEKTWKDYVTSTRLEITCGEAPYLVSRYDTSTGERIPIEKRIGLLDRKLRVINENVKAQRTWNQWVYRAFESIYGYEYQGDNLLIARINLFETFCEYTRERWNEEPSEESLRRIAKIISWNLWQMDGIHGIVPNSDVVCVPEDEEDGHQIDMFEFWGIENEFKEEEVIPDAIECKIYDWCENKEILYKSLREG